MKRFISFLFICICGCSPQLETNDIVQLSLSTKSFINQEELLYYHSGISNWIIKSVDPYRWDIINEIIDNNQRFKTHPLLQSISPTHYALTIFPKSEQEIIDIEKNSGVLVSYIPFDHKVVSLDNCNFGMPVDTTFFSSHLKYSITSPIYDGEGVLLYSETKALPTIYAVWPVDKDLPNQYDYHIDYSVFLPRQSSLYITQKQIIEDFEMEILSYHNPKLSDRGYRLYQGYIIHNDPYLGNNIPVKNLKLRFSLGSNIIETCTTSTGFFSIYAPIEADAQVVFQSNRWKMVSEDAQAPITIHYMVLSNIWINGSSLTLDPKLATIHVAADCFYNDNHGIPIESDSTIRIRVSDSYNGNHSGQFHPGFLGSSCIDISTFLFSDMDLFAIVCHELGHFNHYLIRGGFFNYTSVHRLFKESYANYTGWYICRYYYIKHNLPEHSLWLIPKSSQYWTHTSSGSESHYSPFFVDLVDDYNQHEDVNVQNHLLYNDDPINNLPHYVIKLIIEKRIWSQMKDVLDNYINIYFTQSQYNRFVSPYNYYFQHN